VTTDGISKAERKKLALYYRMIMSYSDFKHAYRCAQYSIQQHDELEKNGGDDLILRALYCSMVVSYSRPFNSTGASHIGRIPSLTPDIESIYSSEEIEVHKYLMWCRNKLLAHTDAEAIDPAPFVATDLPESIVIADKVDALAPFSREYTECVLRLTEKAYHWSVEERYRLEPEIEQWLPREAWMPPEENDGT